ncbi:hypothetical protein CRUP_036509, partial [Coryphaenoides rupestris]
DGSLLVESAGIFLTNRSAGALASSWSSEAPPSQEVSAKLTGASLSVEEIAVTAAAQRHKLSVVLEELNRRLGTGDDESSPAKWDVKLLHSKDFLATLHLLVAMARAFQPDLVLPSNVKVEVVLVEVDKTGIKSDIQTEYLTEESDPGSDSLGSSGGEDAIAQLLKLDAHEILKAKTAILNFVNQKLSGLGLQVDDVDSQFADGVILLLLIGQLEGFFIPLSDFHMSPANHSEKVHNVTLACDLLLDLGLDVSNIDMQSIISRDVSATLKVLYALFRSHKRREQKSTQD